MNDPERLKNGESTAFERQLLDAVARERPSPELVGSMERALGLGSAAAKVGVAASASSLTTYVAVAVLAVGGAVIGFASLRSEKPVVAPAAVVRPAVPARAATPAVQSPTPDAERAPLSAAAKKAPSQNVAPAAPFAGASKPARSNPLKDEIRLVDDARAALRAGSADRALALLDRYDQRFARGAFRQEVAVLRVESLERLGERRKASVLAREFLSEHPDSPHSERVGRALDAGPRK